MPLYDNFGRNALDYGALLKDAWAGRKNLFRNKQAESEEFMKQAAEKQAAFKAAQERNRKAKEAADFQTIKETDLQVDNPVVKPATEPTPEQIRTETIAQEKEIAADAMTPKADVSLANKKFNDYAQQKQRQNMFRAGYDVAPKKIDIQTEQIEQAGKEPEIATAEEIQAYYAKPKEERTNPFLTASLEKETPPTSEPVDAEVLAPEVETVTAKPKARAVLTLPEAEVRNPVGSFHSKYGNVADEAYNQRMADYELEKADAQRKRDVIDRAYRMQEEGYNYFKNQADAANAKDNGEEGAGWGNPLGFVNGIGKAFYGRAVYNPKTGRFEQKTPKSWEELGTNLFRNLATIGSGMRFSAGRNGRGGTSFAMDYNPGMPAAIINSYRQNQFRPYENYENFQKSLAEEYIGKPWQFDVDLPRAKHPFEEEMKKGVADDMLTQSTIRKLDQLAEFYGIPKGSDQYNILADQLFDVKTAIAPKIRDLAKQIDESGLFDSSPKLKNEVLKGAIYNLLGIGDPEDKQTERDLAAQKKENDTLKLILDQEEKARKAELEQAKFEEQKRVNDSTIAKNMWYANGKGAIKTNVVQYDENGNPIELEAYTLPEIELKHNELLAMAEAMEAGTIAKTPKTLKAWAEMFDEYFLRSKDVKDAVKYMGLTKEIDKSTGNTTIPGLSDFRSQFDAEYKALMDQAEQLSQAEQRRAEQFGSTTPAVTAEREALTRRDNQALTTEQRNLARQQIQGEQDRHAEEDDRIVSEAFGTQRQGKLGSVMNLYGYTQAPGTQLTWQDRLKRSNDREGDIAKFVDLNKKGNTLRYQYLSEAFPGIKDRINIYLQESKGIKPGPEDIRRIEYEELDKALNDFEKSLIGFDFALDASGEQEKNLFILDDYVNSLLNSKF